MQINIMSTIKPGSILYSENFGFIMIDDAIFNKKKNGYSCTDLTIENGMFKELPFTSFISAEEIAKSKHLC